MAKGQKKVASNKSALLARLPLACSDETEAVKMFEGIRWGNTPRCAHCNDATVYQMRDRATRERNRRFLWKCKACGKQFTVRVNSVYEDSPIPMRCWAFAFWMACASKKGVSAKQIERETGLSYKSALFLMHRIRCAMNEDFAPSAKLAGIIEADTTYVGGKEKNKHWDQRDPLKAGGKGKTPVFSMVERGGRVRSIVMDRVTAWNLRKAILENVDLGSRLMTDSQSANTHMGDDPVVRHDMVDHKSQEYVRYATDGMMVSTNTVESVFSLLKRGVFGTFHSVTKKHLHRYLSEFDFRYNARRMNDGERTALAIQSASGKRLTYKQQIAKPDVA